MTCLTLPFVHVGTFDGRRQPNILLNEDIVEWLEANNAEHQFLIGMTKDPEKWKVQFDFIKPSDAVLFKLTFGGA